jgi:hypothetical protein
MKFGKRKIKIMGFSLSVSSLLLAGLIAWESSAPVRYYYG